MDQQIDQYIKGLVNDCLLASSFVNLDVDQKNQITEKIENYFSQEMINCLVDNLSEAQLLEIKDLAPESPEMERKMEQFAAEIPGFVFLLQERLEKEAEQIKQSGQIPA